MSDRAAAVIGAQLVPGEELLWAGAPRADRWALLRIIVLSLILIAWVYLLVSDLGIPTHTTPIRPIVGS
jgi:hypothetical protein